MDKTPNAVEQKVPEAGIGIEKFLQGKAILITGATGFLGKAIVEKILRTSQNVSKIYLLIRANDKKAAKQRLKTEVLEAELFKCVKDKYGEGYEAFMMSKLVPVVGNVSQSDLGMEQDLAIAIKKNVHIIINSAAVTSFFPRYDDIIDINAMGPYNLMGFAKKCSKLELFLHLSTAYASLPRPGTIMEEMLSMADITERDVYFNSNNKSLVRFLPAVMLENEMKLIADCKKKYFVDPALAAKELSELGLQRANKFGWPNTYTFVKAMGEMIIDSIREDVPVVIMRPALVEGTYNEPFPGWIEGFKGLDPLAISNGQGKLTSFIGTLDVVLDVVPVDMVVNASLAAMSIHGVTRKADINIYHIASSASHPLALQDCFEVYFYEHFKMWPCVDANGKPINVQKLKIITSMEEFDAHLLREATKSSSPSEMVERRKFMEKAKYMAKCYQPFTTYPYRFGMTNTERLWECMSEDEKKKFGFDLKSIDWKDYIINVHIPGLRKHVMKEKCLSN
ncbi:Male sterility, NAD-binding protein [Corchorus olitorius]|uniref:Fatty acyl-CoA reductase n=1 Tax=Corchorus olitorius TaxID=93759 RepID=A0A1R3HES5_9ROSI|nr:Male sterility, NAD-binding protein [Corchorus olitorius]